MVFSVRPWIDRHRIASFFVITYAFTRTMEWLLPASEMSTSWTLSILTGFGGLGSPIGAAVVVVLRFGGQRLSNHDVPDTSVLRLDDGESRATGPEGMGSVGQECLG